MPDTFFLWLVALTVKAGLVAAAAYSLLRLVRATAVATSFAAWRAVVVTMLLLPPLSLLAPGVPVLPAPVNAVRAGSAPSLPASEPYAATVETLRATPPVVASPWHVSSPETGKGARGKMAFSFQALLVAAYLVGLLGMSGRLVFGLAMSRRLVALSRPIEEAGFLALCRELAAAADLHPVPEVRESSAVRVPVAVGYSHTRILLPREWRDWDRQKLSSVLAHELAHVRRRDPWTYLVCAINRCVYWFHPLAWILPRHLAILAEQACDSMAATWTGDRRRYARHLIEIAGSMAGHRNRFVLEAVPMSGGHDLEARVHALCDGPAVQTGMRRRISAIALAIVVLGSLSSVLRLEAREGREGKTQARVTQAAGERSGEETSMETQEGTKMRVNVVVRERKDDPPDAQLAAIREEKADHDEASKGATKKASRSRAVKLSDRELRARVRDLSSSDPVTRAHAAVVLRKAGVEDRAVVEPLAAMLGDHTPLDPAAIAVGPVPDRAFDGGTHPGLEAAWALGKMGGGGFEPLREAAGSDDWRVRHDAAVGLGFSRDPRAAQPLERLLSDPDARVRARAAWGLSMLGGSESATRLVAMLDSEDAAIREQGARGLGMNGASEAIGALVSALDDPEPGVRAAAAWALGMAQDVSASDALAGALSDGDGRVREQAAWALGMLQDDRASRSLALALEDERWEVRAHAAWALGMGLADDSVDALIVALSDARAEVRDKAAWSLGRLAAGSAAGALEQRLSDESPDVRAQAAWALGMMKAGSARESLERAARDSDPSVRDRARWALRYLDTTGASGHN